MEGNRIQGKRKIQDLDYDDGDNGEDLMMVSSFQEIARDLIIHGST